jgi:transcriptional regulator with XRE-family HTH domain
MSKVIDLLNQAKTKLKASSNYQLAKLSGIPEPRICELYKGTAKPSEEALARLALILDKPIGEVLADVRSEDAKTAKSREFWRDFLSAIRAPAQTEKLLIWCAFLWPGFMVGDVIRNAECALMTNRKSAIDNKRKPTFGTHPIMCRAY